MSSGSPRLIQALAYAAMGWPVFPCEVNGKKPATPNGFKDASTDPDVIRKWWDEADYNIGLEPEQAGLAVIDLDGIGLDQWHDSTPTFSVATPSGGKHIYFEGSIPSTVKKLGSGIDTRGRGGYVLVPPSVISEEWYRANGKAQKGGSYSVIADVDPAVLPKWVTAALQTATDKPFVDSVPRNVDPAAAKARGLDWLEGWLKVHGPVLEGSRDNSAFEVACNLRDVGVSEADALDLLENVFDINCIPPLGSETLSAKIISARHSAKNSAGVWAVAPAQETFAKAIATQESSQPARSLPNPIALRDIAGDEHPVETVVAGWVQKHKLNIFRGRGGTNKSRLALQWSMCIDAGVNKAGFQFQPATCLYLSCEDDAEEMKRRRNAISRKLDLAGSGVLFFDLADSEDNFLLVVTDADGIVKSPKWIDLEHRLLDIPGHKFVVLDSTYDVIDFMGATKNSDNHVRGVIRMFDRLARKTDTTFLCLWHPSRAGMKQGDEGGFATAWDNTPRNAISIKPVPDEENTFALSTEKRNNMAANKPLLLRWADGAMLPISADDATSVMEHEELVQLAIEAAASSQPVTLRGNPGTWFFDEMVARIGRRMSIKEVRDHLLREARKPDGRLYYHNYDVKARGTPAGWHERLSGMPEGTEKPGPG